VSDTVFLDSNILIYAALQPDERSKAARALLIDGGQISVQVLNEFANVARRKLKRSWPEIMTVLADMRIVFPNPVPLTAATHDVALVLAARYGFTFYDALIVASALQAGCNTSLSEDMQDGLLVEMRLTIRNPFLQTAPPKY
jgi:predicted nucleic acid-binding protein